MYYIEFNNKAAYSTYNVCNEVYEIPRSQFSFFIQITYINSSISDYVQISCDTTGPGRVVTPPFPLITERDAYTINSVLERDGYRCVI